jgi:hypothetical protein
MTFAMPHTTASHTTAGPALASTELVSSLIAMLQGALAGIAAASDAAHAQAPTLWLVTVCALVLPALASALAAIVLVRRIAMAGARRLIAAVRPDTAGDVTGPGGSAPERPDRAHLACGDTARLALSAARPLVMIGRQDENDLRLPLPTVHRYHALVHLAGDDGFHVLDLSGRDGNGVRLNGRRVERAALTPGDRLEIGGESIRFEARDHL